ncbi:MAG: HAD family hydrolase [Planctomycetota bacterium]
MTILLFDIDGTLIKTAGAGGTALLEAFGESFGVSEPAAVPFSGRTDRGIVQDLFRRHHVPDSPENWVLLRCEYLRRLRHYLPLFAGEVLPGVRQLLDRLARHSNIAVGLLTGNMCQGARLKLEHYELMHYFSFGGYGDAHADRDQVAHEALAACRRYWDGYARSEPVWVVGDTPLDIQCARAIGAKGVAVATGWHDYKSLEDAQPDLLLHDLRETEAVLMRICAASV